MSMDEERNHRHFKRALLCIVLSILVHIITVICLLLLYRRAGFEKQAVDK